MNIVKTTLLSVLFIASGLTVITAPAQGADALAICNSGQPFLWPGGGANIPFNPDQGDLKSGVINNPTGVALVQASFDNWTAAGPYGVPTSATFVNAGPLPVDVDITNFGPYLNSPAPDGFSAIVFDADGQIFDLLFGPGSGILGFAGPEWGNTITCEILEGLAFLNGPAFTDLTAAEDVMTHEFGHYTNLGHVELNGQLFPFGEGGDTSGPTPDDPFPFGGPLSGEIESMYPFYFGAGSGTSSPHADDVASIATLYPGASFFASTGSISGTVFAADGTTRLSGVNVIARNVANPMLDAVSTFSGAYTNATSQADPNVGVFTLNNLTPGAEYVVFVDQVTAAAGRFSNPILGLLPGPEEYWNAAEANLNPPDDPLFATLVVPVSGSPTTGIDIIFNQPAPGDPLQVGDDGFVELPLPFDYEICGQLFNSVFVNANGNLTFGSGDTDFTESVGEFLRDQPRIAALWDDLSPFNLITGVQQGLVTYAQSRNTFTVIYEDVPEFLTTGSNSFEITLHRASNNIDLVYGEISALDGLTGVSCGGAITSGFESENDLTALQAALPPNGRINLKPQPALFELFTGDNDLGGETLLFNPTRDYNDNWAEPNDSYARARRIKLPFDSIPIPKFTEIEPVGADVDYYRFRVSEGTTLVAEIVSGQLDSLIGLFDPAGNLIALDDDGGTGLLSQLIVPIPLTGEYTLAVSTFADFDFSGDGFSGGRYVLDLFTVDGILLTLGDDTSQQLALGFTFPFQGTDYTDVWVNSNGNLTFGSGDTDFSESISEFLADQPRIAALWDDLNPSIGGNVIADGDSSSMTVSFVGVPEFPATGSNTFSVTMHADGSINISYAGVTATDGLVGVTPGGLVPGGAGAVDLSTSATWSATGSTYEQFIGGNPFDLDLSAQDYDP